MNKTNIKDSSNCTSLSPLWQALEYRKRLKKLIEQGALINELDKQAKLLFKEMNDGKCRQN
ncbi:TPA: hypothetical protein ACPQYX_000296 [Haemophilus influenzae]|uniref:hypothetical protein n=1 Tax=Haemophilus influenzae TaxID=727 RepID=UPI0001A3F764|nr:hypothetical protein [Haemophilus influenzae]AWP53631.1 hypothetical protein DLJ98_02135 [Haemophilus influenzae]AWP55907.1 hypothetical protein DLK00_06975 [Haemophilus influenzae]EEP48420.1 hypothetical protein CGSHi6P18H1_09210 [Haemophilus influenzae 6P18H1]KKZ20638.1 hypothetical protein AAY75_08215 [Haemophilus influenzae 2019]MCK8941831.1 hypothetical protein [Haemophilus influenzae]